MADSELGELRRPPRPVEQRIERLARWKAQGLAGGASDSPFPVDYVDGTATAGVSEDGGSGGIVPDWYFESFSVTSGSASTVSLTYVPIVYSEVVRLNGVTLSRSVDYTISESTLTFTDLTSLRLGIGANTWTLDVFYAYTDTAIPPFEASDFLTWTLNGDASVVGSTVRLNPAANNKTGSMICPDIIPSGWSQIIVSVNLTATDGDGWEVDLWDAAVHTTAELGAVIGGVGETYYSAVINDTAPSTNLTGFQSNDGTTTLFSSASPADGGGTNVHDFVWTKTGANTATVDRYKNSVLQNSAATNRWVPTTVRVGVAAFSGALYSNAHTVTDCSITVT